MQQRRDLAHAYLDDMLSQADRMRFEQGLAVRGGRAGMGSPQRRARVQGDRGRGFSARREIRGAHRLKASLLSRVFTISPSRPLVVDLKIVGLRVELDPDHRAAYLARHRLRLPAIVFVCGSRRLSRFPCPAARGVVRGAWLSLVRDGSNPGRARPAQRRSEAHQEVRHHRFA